MDSAPRGRRRGPRRVFTEDAILDAAQQLLDEGGPDAVSVRAIAKKLGVAPNTIYTYFADKAAVTEALVERLLRDVDHGVFADRNQPWRQRVEAVALELRAHLAAHPGALQLIMSSPLNGPHALTLNEHILDLFADAGLAPTTAARASYVLTVYVFGSRALELADLRSAGPDVPESDRIAARRRALSKSPADRYPRISAAADAIADGISTNQYLWGLHRVLDGITGSATTQDPSETPSRTPRT